jgi:hypothetical protein
MYFSVAETLFITRFGGYDRNRVFSQKAYVFERVQKRGFLIDLEATAETGFFAKTRFLRSLWLYALFVSKITKKCL